MDSALSTWLEESTHAELLFGVSWLKGRIEEKLAGAKLDHRGWTGLYEDNGSCLNITVERDDKPRVVQVIQELPLILSDGHTFVQASTSSKCQQEFTARYHKGIRPSKFLYTQLYSLLVVNKFSITATSYGPPSEQVELVIDQLDWERGSLLQPVGRPKPCVVSAIVTEVLSNLAHIRELEDSKYVGGTIASPCANMSQHPPTHVDEDDDMLDNSFEASHVDFATQAYPDLDIQLAQRSPRRRPRGGGGVVERSMEPIMLGNVRSRELSPGDRIRHGTAKGPVNGKRRGTPQAKNPAALLSLIHKNPVQPLSKYTSPGRTKHEQSADPYSDTSDTNMETASRGSSIGIRAEAAEKGITKSKTPPVTAVIPIRQVSTPSHGKTASPKHGHLAKSLDAKEPRPQRPEAEWLQGWTFDADTAEVPSEQLKLLNSKDSWHKPPPGHRFTDGNMPINIFREIEAVFRAQSRAEDSDQDMEADDQGDISSEVENEQEEDGEEDKESEVGQDDEDLPTSPVSWAASPVRESPKRPFRNNRDLPPDSSIEAAQATAGAEMHEQRNRSLVAGNNEPALPPSSPPVPADTNSPAEDMDMEIDVPHGLGYDRPPSTLASIPGLTEVLSSMPPPREVAEPIVQVKDTPYAKGKDAKPLLLARSQASSQNQTSSGTSKNTSSTSIVYGTYKEVPSSHDRQNDNVEPGVTAIADGNRGAIVQPVDTTDGDVLMAEVPAKETQPPAESGMDAQDIRSGKLDSRSGSFTMKRKSSGSPSKSNIHERKRRELRNPGFSQLAPVSQDPGAAYREDRRRFLHESPHDSQTEPNASSIQGQQNHSVSMQLKDEEDIDSPINGVDSLELAGSRHQSTEMLIDEPRQQTLVQSSSAQKTPAGPVSPQSRREIDLDDDDELVLPRSLRRPSTIFEQFKAAYPAYKGGQIHFRNLCTSMLKLEDEDRMVPKWQWDDYLVRERTEYSRYALSCVQVGKPPVFYIRYYKDNVSDLKYDQGILKDTATLELALSQLPPPSPEHSPAPRPREPSRQSFSFRNGHATREAPDATRTREHLHTPSGHGPSKDSHLYQSPRPGGKITNNTNNNIRDSTTRRPTYGSPKTIGTLSSMTNTRASQDHTSRRTSNGTTNGQTERQTNGHGAPGGRAPKRKSMLQDFLNNHQKLKSMTGCEARDLESRPKITRKKNMDVIAWKDEL